MRTPKLFATLPHGMEDALTVRKTLPNGSVRTTDEGVKYNKRGETCGKRAVVRYADDFVVFCESREDAEKSVSILTEWLKGRGLTLSPEKTRIVHLSEGFDFLGFNVRHYEAKQTSRSGWKLLIKPSKKSVQKIRDKLRDKWLLMKGQNVKTVIGHLNPVIRGWANYFRIGVASEIFGSLDNWMFQREIRHIRRTHPTKPWYWRQARYFGRLNLDRDDNWVFGDKHTGMHLQKFVWFPIERHILVQGDASPDDPSLRDF
ncbi:MAG: reverse transcriptase domain-containing protein [Acidobacteriota bacterium]|nr:reverse transcriptase domain-containing protein [Acidobacteriota bacterium]